MTTDLLHHLATTLASEHPELQLLLLFGSRARGDHRQESDWDLAFMAKNGFDLAGAQVTASTTLGTDRIDFVDLGHATALLRQRVARDGVCLFDADQHDFAFRTHAALFWCDVEPVLRRAHADVLARVQR